MDIEQLKITCFINLAVAVKKKLDMHKTDSVLPFVCRDTFVV